MGAYLQTDLDRRIHHETVILYSVETGAPLILFQDCAINENRTAAAGGHRRQILGPRRRQPRRRFRQRGPRRNPTQSGRRRQRIDASAGFQPNAKTPCKPSRKSSARELEISVHAVSSAEEALESADIVITATDSKTPVFDGEQLPEGISYYFDCQRR